MITKKEMNKIKSALNFQKGREICVYADRTNMKIDQYVYNILTEHVENYKRTSGNKKIGKAAYLHILLQDFAKTQYGVLESVSIGYSSFSNTLNGLQAFKKIMRRYVDDSITTQSHTVLALLTYYDTRLSEIKNGEQVVGYIDYEYEGTDNVKKLLETAKNEGLVLEVS